jgi:hypothetical protein
MNTIPTWAVLILAIFAGAGLPTLLERFRPRPVDPVTRAAEVIADSLGPATRAPGRTALHGHETIDILAEGFAAGQTIPHSHRRTDAVDAGGVRVDPATDGRFSRLPAGMDGDEDSWFIDAPPRTPQ